MISQDSAAPRSEQRCWAMKGNGAIHPSQIVPANEVFTPSADEVARARRILDAMAQATREGRGAVSLDGRLIDLASIRMAEALTAKADAMGAHV